MNLRKRSLFFFLWFALLGLTLKANNLASRLKEAEGGDAIAQFNLGRMYALGEGVEKNEAEGVKWYEKAAEQGLVEAQYALGLSYLYGSGVPSNPAQSIKWFTKSAELGYATAQYSLGLIYYQGKGVHPDKVAAAKWHAMAAKQGYAPAQFSLGNLYESGEGVKQDIFIAAEWFKKAAEQGNADAQCSLGIAFMFGQGVERNQVEGLKWLLRSIDQGSSEAMNCLGVLYQNGKVVEKNTQEAEKLFIKAAAKGNEIAKKNLAVLREEIKESELGNDERHFPKENLGEVDGEPSEHSFLAEVTRTTNGQILDEKGFAKGSASVRKGDSFEVFSEDISSVTVKDEGELIKIPKDAVRISEGAAYKTELGSKLRIVSAKMGFGGDRKYEVKEEVKKRLPKGPIAAPVEFLVSDDLLRSRAHAVNTVTGVIDGDTVTFKSRGPLILTITYEWEGQRLVKEAAEGSHMKLP